MSKNCWISSGSLISVDTGCDVINASLTITGKMSSTTWRANCKYSNSQQISRICFSLLTLNRTLKDNVWMHMTSSLTHRNLFSSIEVKMAVMGAKSSNARIVKQGSTIFFSCLRFVCLFVCFFFSFLSADQLACTNATRVGYGQSTLD